MDEHHEQEELESPSPPAGGCRSCGRPPKWESLTDHLGERWLAVCGCGRLDVFLPDQPNADRDDPLRIFLAGPDRHILPATPPWIRFFLNSIKEPRTTGWRYLPFTCSECNTAVTFGTQAWPQPGVNGRYLLCLGCGEVTVNYSNMWQNRSETTSGSNWTPACPAVQRLRDCVYRLEQHQPSGPAEDATGEA